MRRVHGARGFTLLELLVVIAIVGMLASLAAPEYTRLVERARSAGCMGNLRSIGVAFSAYLADNDGRIPYINNPPPYEIYDEDDDLPEDTEALTMLEAFGPYGVTEKTLRCPSDARAGNYFATLGTSYEWIPRVDGEQSVSPKVLSRRGQLFTRQLGRVSIVQDFTPVHFGRMNRLRGDGRVIWVQR